MVDRLGQFEGCMFLFLLRHGLNLNFLRSFLFLGLFLGLRGLGRNHVRVRLSGVRFLRLNPLR